MFLMVSLIAILLSIVQTEAATLSMQVDQVSTSQIRAIVSVAGAKDLDSYSFPLYYDTAAAQISFAGISQPSHEIANALETTGRQTIPMVKRDSGMVTISATLVGDDAPGIVNGVVGVVVFTIKGETPLSLRIGEVTLLDHARRTIECTVVNPGVKTK